MSMLQIASSILTQNPNRALYLNVAIWNSDPASITALQFMQSQDKWSGARGFALNTSGYALTSVYKVFGEAVAVATGLKYIVDTSRNAKGGVSGQWRTSPIKVLGEKPLSEINVGNMDGNIWIKPPGESDGTTDMQGGTHPDAGHRLRIRR